MLPTKPLKISAKDLTPRENRIISSLREEPKTTNEMAEEFGVTYHAVKKPLDGLVNKGLVEQDTERAFGKAKYYRIKRLPSDGIELEIRVKGELTTVSFNTFLEMLAKSIARGDVSGVAKSWAILPTSVAYLGAYAAAEFENPGSVSEVQLLNVRSQLQKYLLTLQEEYRRGSQILNNESFWNAKSLAQGTLSKTDRFLTADDVREYCRIIVARFAASNEQGENENKQDVDDENVLDELDSEEE